MLAVCGLTYTTETVTFYNALEAFTFGGAGDVDKVAVGEDVHADGVTKGIFFGKTIELGQVSLGGYAGGFEMAEFGFGAVFFFLLLKTELEGCIAVFLNCLDLSNHARTYFDNSAWNVFSLGTENGCHSDFFSN